MSGHSKWSTIKHKKAAQDAKKGRAFSVVGKMIRVAVKEGKSGDPDQNPALRLALEKARSVNMPKDNVERAITKGLGKSASGTTIEEVVYEAYGPGGVGIRIEVVTDNRNRTAAEIRSLLERHGGSLAGPGSTAFLFSVLQNGEIEVKVPLAVSAQVAGTIEALIDLLETHDDVESVMTNMTVA